MSAEQTLTPDELRVEIFRSRVPLYILAAKIKLHPASLSAVLNGRRPLRSDVAARILAALEGLRDR